MPNITDEKREEAKVFKHFGNLSDRLKVQSSRPTMNTIASGDVYKKPGPLVVDVYGGVGGDFELRQIVATPDPHPETTTVDGYAYTFANLGTSWNDIRTGVGNGASDNAITLETQIRCDGNVDKWDYCKRSIMGFDLSAIPSGATVMSASLELSGKATAVIDDWGAASLVLTQATVLSNTAVTLNDFDLFGNTELAQRITAKVWRGLGGNTFYFNENGIKFVQIYAGSPMFVGTRISYDFDNDKPAWSAGDQARFDIASSEDTAYSPPTLVVLYKMP